MQNQSQQYPEYRPCVVTESIPCEHDADGYLHRQSERYHKALFHFWTERHQYYNNTCGYGLYAQPSHVIQVTAIVEYEDGTVHEVLPQEIRFMDGKVKEHDFKSDE